MKFAKVLFWIAGIFGVLALTPLYFMLDTIGRQAPPAITHLQFYYGFIGGSGAWPMDTIPTFIGAWLGRRYFAKKFGLDNWRMYTPVLLAGFACGTGLIAMASIALALIAKSVNYLPF